MDDINFLLLFSRFAHLSAAIVAIGGTLCLRFAVMPGAEESLDDEKVKHLREAIRRRWARFVHGCMAVLLFSGFFNFYTLAIVPKVDPFPYHAIFGIKFLLALTVFFIAAALVGRSPSLAWIRQNSRKWLSTIIALAAVIVLLSGVLGQLRAHAAHDASQTTLATEP